MSIVSPANKGILGKKLGMTQVFNKEGDIIPVTIIEAGPCNVVQKKTVEKDGYASIQLGFKEKQPRLVNKPETGHFKKANVTPKKYLKELRFSEEVYQQLNIGDLVTVAQFEENEYVDVIGISKGKGFAGVMKKNHFHGFPASRGTHESFRGAGSVGMHTNPGRVHKGKAMPGHLGSERVSQPNLRILKIDAEKGILYVKGSIPGMPGGYVIIRDAVKKASEPATFAKSE